MKKSKFIITSLFCFLIALNFVFLSANSYDLERVISVEFETESESEPENNNKSKLGYLGFISSINFLLKNSFKHNFVAKSLFCQDFICEVPTSPPNNC